MTIAGITLGAASKRFELLRSLGEGAVGVVYEAHDGERGTHVALKVLKRWSAETLYSLKHEFRALANISHPNLISYFDLVVEENTAFFTMELVPGGDFLGWLRGGDQVDRSRLRDGFGQLASGVAVLHQAGLLHRDIKPSNIQVTHDGRVVLLDFGLALLVDHSRDMNALEGTAAYMSPEQACGETLTPASDMYSMGVVLYEALTGRKPFAGSTEEVLSRKIAEVPPAPSTLSTHIPEDLDRLCMELLEQDPQARPTAFDLLQRLGASAERSTRTSQHERFVGRDAELTRLLATAIRTGEARIALLRGPSGIGKSSLFGHFVRRLREEQEEPLVLEGRCYEGERIAFQAIDDVVDNLARVWDTVDKGDLALPADAALLPRLFPVLGRVASLEALAGDLSPTLNMFDARTRAFSALRVVLQRFAERRLLVVHLDDMQWSDLDTLALLSDLMRPPDPPALFLVLGSRVEGSEPILSFLEGTGVAYELFDLAPLGDDDARKLAEILLGGNTGDADRLVHEAEGNPFFLGELARARDATGGSAGAAKSLEEVIARRISTLSADARTLLELVALSFSPPSLRVLGTAAGLEPQLTLRIARMLRIQRFVRTPAGQKQERLESYHDRIRKGVLLQLANARARHRALAQALELRREGLPEQLTYHWFGAGDMPRAALNAREAARKAKESLNFDRAAELLRLLLDTGCCAPDERGGILRDCADALSLAGRPRDAAQMYFEASKASPRQERSELQRCAAEHYLRGGYINEGLATVRDVLREVGVELASSPWVAVARLMLLLLWFRIRGTRWTPREPALQRPHDLFRVDVLWSVGLSLGWIDMFRGFDLSLRALLLALRLGDSERIARAMGWEALRSFGLGEGKRGFAYAAIALKKGDDSVHNFGRFAEGANAYYVDNDWPRAHSEFDRGVEAITRTKKHPGWILDTGQLLGCFSMLYAGELRELGKRVPALVREAERRGDMYSAVGFRVRIPAPFLLRDDPDGAQKDIQAAILLWAPPRDIYHLQHLWAVYSRCEILLYRGNVEAAAEELQRALRSIERSMLLTVPMLRVEVLDLRARIALGMAARCEGPRRAVWQRAARTAYRKMLRVRLPVAGVLAAFAKAGLAAQQDGTVVARGQLLECIRRFDEMHMKSHAAAARTCLGNLVAGDEGAALVTDAARSLGDETVRNPRRWVAMLAPWDRTAEGSSGVVAAPPIGLAPTKS